MYFDNRQSTPTVGSFIEEQDTGFKQCLTRLSETFASQHQLDYSRHIVDIMSHQNLLEQYNDILLEDYVNATVAGDESLHRRNGLKLMQLVENARQDILSESMSANLMPIVGLTFPLLKRYWINCVYKDFIPTEVATTPVVNIGIERQFIQDQNGKKYYLPEAFDTDLESILGAIRRKLNDDKIPVPSMEFDLITAAGGSVRQQDTISKNFYISSIFIKVPSDDASGYTEVEVDGLRIDVNAGTGAFNYTVKQAGLGSKIAEVAKDMLTGTLDFETGLFNVGSMAGLITGVKVTGSLSSENHLTTASTGWDKSTKQFVIPDGDHLATGLTEERIKDEKILFNVDTTAKAIQAMTDVLTQFKDLRIKRYLDDSRTRLEKTSYFKRAIFDCKPPAQYVNTPTEWRKVELKETLDRLAISLKYILKNKNCYFAIMGNPMDVKLLDDVNWIYGQDAEVGGTKLEYSIGLYNNQHRFYIVSSERATQGKLQVLLIPTTEEHITYKHFEYQFIISNQYRTAENVRVPSVMVSERSLTDEVMPIQGEIQLLNNAKLGTSEMYM